MKVVWRGGALDGCALDMERPTLTWIGPDVTEPDTKVLVYILHSTKDPNREQYVFDQYLTDKANEYLRDGT